MYVKRLQLASYGPIANLDIEMPFEGDSPRPVVLVGENGSGKTILLSHIVNGLLQAKAAAYPDSPEVEPGKVYKLRSNEYIKAGSGYSFSRVEFEQNLFTSELRTVAKKGEDTEVPLDITGTAAEAAWNSLRQGDFDYLDSSFLARDEAAIREIFDKNCILYFPSDRFEDPAWLNREHLEEPARYMDVQRITGQTSRRIIAQAPLRENRDWLFDLLYDRAVFELQTGTFEVPVGDSDTRVPLPLMLGHQGQATGVYDAALKVVRAITRQGGSRFAVGRRSSRKLSLVKDSMTVVPNVFQLSSGETSLLNLFLSILRDFDLAETPYTNVEDLRGIVVVDEADLHLHAVLQHDVLPTLIKMFPNVQFIMTTHSPLFVLGMAEILGENGFKLYDLPEGESIRPESFDEFGAAYAALTATNRFARDVRETVGRALQPIVYMEGTTDILYLQKAAELLGHEDMLASLQLLDGNGDQLKATWQALTRLDEEVCKQPVVVVRDCDFSRDGDRVGKRFLRRIPYREEAPIKKGIENLLGRETLERARAHKPDFIDVVDQHQKTVRGVVETVPENWTVNADEKMNLCQWLCSNGTKEDFAPLEVVFTILEETLGDAKGTSSK